VSRLLRIIRMEFRMTAASRTFVVVTILGPFLLAAVMALPTLLSTRQSATVAPPIRLALAGVEDPSFYASVTPALEQAGMTVEAAGPDTEALDARVLADELDGYVILPADLASATRIVYVSRTDSDFRITSVLQGVIGQSIVASRLAKAGVSAELSAALLQMPAVETTRLVKASVQEQQDVLTILATGLVFAMLIAVTVLLFGQATGRSVLREKRANTVETMLSSVRPLELLFGKILGKALASILQYGIWVAASLAFMELVGPHLGGGLQIAVTPATMGFLVAFFLLDFFLYCPVYAALGSASEDDPRLAQLSWPAILLLVVPTVLISPILSSPNSPLVVALSIFPFTAAMAMFLRMLVTSVPPGQLWLSVGLLAATIIAVVVVSARIVRVGLLMTGRRCKPREIVRWIGYRAPSARP
jgi:ABC-2 type transport system permease protein